MPIHLFQRLVVGRRRGGIDQVQHHVGARHLGQRALDADPLDRIFGGAQAGGVDHVEQDAVHRHRLHDAVAGGAGHRGDDRHLLAGQGVEQARLADVRRPDQHDVQAVAQHRALPGAVEHVVELRADRRQPAARVGRLQEVDLLLGKVQRRLDQRAQLEQRLDQDADALRELAG
jgi:hypothetical protein